MLNRVLRGVGANGYSQVVTIAVQLLSVPIFISAWSLEQYGQWLLITAIPAYLAVTDFGIVVVAGNKMTMLVAEGKHREALGVFHSAQVFLAISGGSVLVLSAVILIPPVLAPFDQETRLTLLVLIASLILGQVGGLGEAVLRATSRFATGVVLSATSRFAEWLGYLGGLYLGGSFISVALGGLAGKALVTALLLITAHRGQRIFTYGYSRAARSDLKALLTPALGFMTVTATNALTIQGFTILAGIFLGPSSVVVFNTYRTLSRLSVQASSALSHSVWPEFSRIFGSSDQQKLKQVYRRTGFSGALLAIGISATTWFLAPQFLSLWTHGQVDFMAFLMMLFCLYSAVVGAAHTPRVLLMATNTHFSLARWGAVVSLMSILTAALLAPIFEIYGLASAMVFGESVMLVTVLIIVRRFMDTAFPTEGFVSAR